jgi:alpha-galactosidase
VAILFGALSTITAQAQELVFFNYSQDTGWYIGNDQFRARFRMEPDSTFRWVDLQDSTGYTLWESSPAEPSSPIDLRIDNTFINARTPLRLVGQRHYNARNNGRGYAIVFHDMADQFEFELLFEIHPGHPVLHQQVRVKNLRGVRVFFRANDILPYAPRLEGVDYRVFRVNQWSVLAGGRNFEPLTTTLTQPTQRVTMQTGAGGMQCTWVAIAKPDNVGLIAGWEFDGRADATFLRTQESLDLSVRVASLMHPVDANGWYDAPPSFIGIFLGDWDEAGYRTQRYAEAALAPKVDDPKFPYIAWDSWGYEKEINEVILRREADLAAARGVELFIVDLGWAKQMGDWEEDPKKFPSGLRAFSDYVHSKGMKFGLHYVISEAMADSKVLRDHPEWACSTSYNYHGALSLALAHKPVQDWVIEQGVKIIRDYNVDWILQDGQTMVKQCTNTGLSYDPRDWNYSGDEGLNRILREIQAQTPNTVWENCANGGNMMTFSMVRNYVTSITNDASGSLGSRQGLFGASFPFPPRYTDRYMPSGPMTDYNTRSFMFGGPWILMNRLDELNPEELNFLESEIKIYKEIRQSISNAKILHLTLRPALGRIDAIQSYNPGLDEAIAIVTRDSSNLNRFTLRFRDLRPTQTYRVSFADDRRVFTMTGQQLMTNGVSVNLPERESGEIVYARPLGQ